MLDNFKKKEELMKTVEENEAKYKDREAPEFEKGDKLAIFIASFLIFAPLILLMVALFLISFLFG